MKWAYWLKTGLLNILYIVLAGTFFGVFQALVNGTLTFINVATTGLYYAIPLSSILICFCNISKINFMSNIVISMGETRKHVVLGIAIMNISMVVTVVAAIFVLNILSGNKLIDFNTIFTSVPAIYILAIGCGLCINSLKYENTIETSTVQLVLMLVSIILLFTLNTLLGTFLNDAVVNVSKYIRLGAMVFSLVFGILLCAIGYVRMKKKIMQLEINL